jgi:hypothetical protein
MEHAKGTDLISFLISVTRLPLRRLKARHILLGEREHPQETEAGGSRVGDQPGLHSKTLSYEKTRIKHNERGTLNTLLYSEHKSENRKSRNITSNYFPIQGIQE